MNVLVVDGYTDEPAALGVPPYIAPLPRYVAGAVVDAGLDVPTYVTIDQLRHGGGRPRQHRDRTHRRPPLVRDWGELRQRLSIPGEGDWHALVLVGGAVVPGRYLRGRPASIRELAELAGSFPGMTVLVGPVARYGWTSGMPASRRHLQAFDHVAALDGDALVHDLLGRGEAAPCDRYRTKEEWARWSVMGASILEGSDEVPHPLIAEVETYRGCVRYITGGCSFCTTVRDSPPTFRDTEEVAEEVRAMARMGVVSFRLGGQSCIYSYRAEEVGETEVPTPSPQALEALLAGVRGAAPDLEVLHVDNANPAVIAEHPEESRKVTQLLVEHCTGGNVVALGLESADPAVKEANNLNSTAEQCLDAIRSINEVGGESSGTGLPQLLPGVNLLSGLRGETGATFGHNMRFLQRVAEEGLLLRRINLRQVAPVCGKFDTRRHHTEFRRFKEQVRREIDLPMLERLLPFGASLRRVWTEVHDGNTTFGRQIGSYPLTVGIPARVDLGRFMDVQVVDHGYRSVTAVPCPLDLNGCPISMLESIPGIGRRRAARLVRARPIRGQVDLGKALDEAGPVQTLARLDLGWDG